MGIELENPKTPQEKIDAAHNLVNQARIALTVKNYGKVMSLINRSDELLFEAMRSLESGKNYF